jgi:hypothetical protein
VGGSEFSPYCCQKIKPNKTEKSLIFEFRKKNENRLKYL